MLARNAPLFLQIFLISYVMACYLPGEILSDTLSNGYTSLKPLNLMRFVSKSAFLEAILEYVKHGLYCVFLVLLFAIHYLFVLVELVYLFPPVY
jgi:hypothetical protein